MSKSYLVEVIAKGYYGRVNGRVQQLPIGHQFVVNSKPASWGSKLRVIKEVDSSQMVVNDNPLAAALREDGKAAQADKANADEPVSGMKADDAAQGEDGKAAQADKANADEPVKRGPGRPRKTSPEGEAA